MDQQTKDALLALLVIAKRYRDTDVALLPAMLHNRKQLQAIDLDALTAAVQAQ